VRTQHRTKAAGQACVPQPGATAPNQRWSMDFMSERVADGRWFRILTVVDQFTRECLCLVLTPSATLQAPMGYGVAVRKQYYTLEC
jgi:putative transposase